MNWLKNLYFLLKAINLHVGRWVGWLAVLMVAVQFAVVLTRYVFGFNSIFAQESIVYMHALLFILGAGFTFIQDGHVRVDILYQSMSAKNKAKVNIIGVCVFLLPFLTCLCLAAMPYVAQSWAVLEGSKETSGIQAVYLLKGSLYAFCLLLACQGLALVIKSLFVLQDWTLEENADSASSHANPTVQ